MEKSRLPEVIYTGSVKNVRGQKGQDPYYFEFSDRYSVFDWGEMPDHLEHKGESLAMMAHILFAQLGQKETWSEWSCPINLPLRNPFWQVLEKLREEGLPHHSLGLVNERGEKLPPGEKTRFLKVKSIVVDPPKAETSPQGTLSWNYSAYQEKRKNHLVPLEIIFRFGAPPGSSLKKRIHDAEYRKELGLDEIPREGEFFSRPVLEFSTKLEPSDRYVKYDEAKRLAGLSQKEFTELYNLALGVALRLKDLFADMGVELWDGKLEFAFQEGAAGEEERSFMLVDAIGPDELRLLKDGLQLSKEILRQFYGRTPWYAGVEKAKVISQQKGREDWQRICREELSLEPQPLPREIKNLVEEVYMGLGNCLSEKFYGKEVFRGAATLEESMGALKKYH